MEPSGHMAGRLIVLLGGVPLEGIKKPLAEGTRFSLGRSAENGLILPHPDVGLRHAELRVQHYGLTITQLTDEAATTVEGVAIAEGETRTLTHGMEFVVGPFTVRFEAAWARERVAPGSAPADGLTTWSEPPSPELDAAWRPAPLPPVTTEESRYLFDLPMIFHDPSAPFLGRYLRIFEHLWEPLEIQQDQIASYADPGLCPPSFVTLLAEWLGIAVDPSLPELRQRALVREGIALYRQRGTARALARVLGLSIGRAIKIAEVAGEPCVIEVTVAAPEAGDDERARLYNQVETLLQIHKPAHVGYRLRVIG